jgi:hypothetical protein
MIKIDIRGFQNRQEPKKKQLLRVKYPKIDNRLEFSVNWFPRETPTQVIVFSKKFWVQIFVEIEVGCIGKVVKNPE